MVQNNPEGPVCQSCGKPTNKQEDLGTNNDGSRNSEYCSFCFQKGKFTYPNINVDHMIDIYASLMMAMKDIPENEAKEAAKSFIPTLKRWK